MSDADTLARLEAIVARLEALGIGVVDPFVASNPDGTPGNVASGELIESAWGNAVANTITKLKIPNHINTDGNAIGHLQMESGRFAGQVDANGLARINYQTAYSLPYTLTASSVKWADSHTANPVNPDATGFTLSVRLITTGYPAANEFVDCCWQAIGRRP